MRLFKKNKDIAKNRKVTKARFLYLYVIFGSILGFVYFISSIIMEWPKHFALTPIYLLVVFLVLWFLKKNWKMIWFFIINVERGKLLLFLNKSTHWEESFKIKVSKWIILSKRRVRLETKNKITKKLMDGEELTREEQKLYKYKSVFCPQQMKLGFNEALLVNALIYTHRSIIPLDDEIRDIMNLTDDHILKFNLMSEYKKAGGNEYDRLMKIGERKSKELNKS